MSYQQDFLFKQNLRFHVEIRNFILELLAKTTECDINQIDQSKIETELIPPSSRVIYHWKLRYNGVLIGDVTVTDFEIRFAPAPTVKVLY